MKTEKTAKTVAQAIADMGNLEIKIVVAQLVENAFLRSKNSPNFETLLRHEDICDEVYNRLLSLVEQNEEYDLKIFAITRFEKFKGHDVKVIFLNLLLDMISFTYEGDDIKRLEKFVKYFKMGLSNWEVSSDEVENFVSMRDAYTALYKDHFYKEFSL